MAPAGVFTPLQRALTLKPAWFHLKKGRNPMDLVYVGILALFVLLAWGLLALCDRV
jgi:hypothetical protein